MHYLLSGDLYPFLNDIVPIQDLFILLGELSKSELFEFKSCFYPK